MKHGTEGKQATAMGSNLITQEPGGVIGRQEREERGGALIGRPATIFLLRQPGSGAEADHTPNTSSRSRVHATASCGSGRRCIWDRTTCLPWLIGRRHNGQPTSHGHRNAPQRPRRGGPGPWPGRSGWHSSRARSWTRWPWPSWSWPRGRGAATGRRAGRARRRAWHATRPREAAGPFTGSPALCCPKCDGPGKGQARGEGRQGSAP